MSRPELEEYRPLAWWEWLVVGAAYLVCVAALVVVAGAIPW